MHAILVALLMCLEPTHYGMTQAQCTAAVDAARHNPDLGYLVALIEEQA